MGERRCRLCLRVLEEGEIDRGVCQKCIDEPDEFVYAGQGQEKGSVKLSVPKNQEKKGL